MNTRTANCQAHVSLADGAPGWQVGLRDLWSRGHVELEPGVTLKQYVTVFYSQDAGNTVSVGLSSPLIACFLYETQPRSVQSVSQC